jgi:DNA-binding MarR family transcriptional regulator
VIDDLVGRGWLRARDDDRLELTEHGQRAHALLHQRVTATRQLALRGVTEQEYLALIDILRRIASNLESAAT